MNYNFLYWIVLFSVLTINFFQKKEHKFYLQIGFYSFIAGVILKVIGLNEIAEFIMRMSFIFWVIGLWFANS